MTQVFIIYASPDRAHAQQLARALQQRGYEVWWDRELIAGPAFNAANEQALESADCAVLLWSSNALASDGVRREASAAAEREALVAVRIEAVTLPLEFGQGHTVDLTTWQGQTDHAGFDELCRGIDARHEGARLMAAARARPPETRPDIEATRSNKQRLAGTWIWRAGAVITVLAGLGIVWSAMRIPAAPKGTAAADAALRSPGAASSTPSSGWSANAGQVTAPEARGSRHP